MLHLVEGRSGSGKTEYVRTLLGNMARDGADKLILIVPEQYSFDTERAMLKTFGNTTAQSVEVLSFTRLSDFVFRTLGGNAGVVADDGTKLILMLRAMNMVAHQLDYYEKYKDDVRLARELIQVHREVRQSAAALNKLEEAAGAVESPVLSRKLHELFLIFDAYDGLFQIRYSDEEQQTEKLCRTLEETPFFNGYTLAIDGFKSFTGQELLLLGLILNQAKDVYVTLCTDGPTPSPSMVFHSVNETAKRLRNMAKERNVPVRIVPAKESGIQSGRRFECPELAFLEENLFYPSEDTYDGTAEHITVCETLTVFEECEYIAATARKLLREEGLRARDIAVIVRNEEDYKKELLRAFRRYHLPFFEDVRQPVENQPLVVLCRTVLSILSQGFTSDNLLRYMKTGLAGVTPEEIADLENYVFTWDIKGSSWKQDFPWNPFGLDAAFRSEEEADEALRLLNNTRKRVMDPLLSLKRATTKTSYRKIGEELYMFLIRTKVPEQLKAYAVSLDEAGLSMLAGEQDRIWDVVIQVIDKLTAVYGEEECTLMKQYADLFYAILSMTDLGNIPQGLDAITVSAADRVRLSSPHTVFVAGCEEGVFPAVVAQNGLFTLHERNALREQGLELSFPEDLRASEERFIAYSAVTAPRSRLYVSWHRLDASGGSYRPSELVAGILKLFTGENGPTCHTVVAETLPADYFAETEESAYTAYAEHLLTEQSQSNASVREALRLQDTSGTYEKKFRALDKARTPREYRIEDTAIATDLFKKDMSLSASRVDNYYHCAFQYFCRYGLNAEPRKKATLSANNYGTIIHYVLEQLLKESTKETFIKLSQKDLRKRVDHWMETYAEEELGGLSDKTTRFQYLYNRLNITLYDVAERLQEELKVSDFIPSDFELPIGKDNTPIPSYELELPDGGTLAVNGSVDRVDLCKQDGKTYVRVVDYKSGGKAFELSDILYGLNLQMLIYLFAIEQNGTGKYENVLPAGILYYPAKRIGGSVPNRTAGPELAKLDKQTKDTQNGLLLGNASVLEAMEHDLPGNFLPVYWKTFKTKDPELQPADSLASLSELGKLKKRIDFLLKKMATDLHEGSISAVPAEQGGRVPCSYCDYRAVCRPEDVPTRLIEKLPRDQIFSDHEQEVNHHGE